MDEGKGEGKVMSERDSVMQSVKEAISDVREGVSLPDYDSEILVSSAHKANELGGWREFSGNFSAVNGRPMTQLEDLANFLKQDGHDSGYCDPGLKETVGEAMESAGLKVNYDLRREHINDHAFGITRASGLISESGTVVLNDEDTVDRLAALAPWVHVAVIKDEPIFETISEAIDSLGDSSNVIWVTGPSKTADIEGILIEGVHGPGVQICLKIE